MNRDELVENLGTIAHSGARTFLQNAGKGQEHAGGDHRSVRRRLLLGLHGGRRSDGHLALLPPGGRAAMWQSVGDSRFSWRRRQGQPRHRNPHQAQGGCRRVRQHLAAGERRQASIPTMSPSPSMWRARKASRGCQPAHGALAAVALQRRGERSTTSSTSSLPGRPRAAAACAPGGGCAGQRAQHPLCADAARARRAAPAPDYGLRLYSRKVLIQEHSKDCCPNTCALSKAWSIPRTCRSTSRARRCRATR
jgi:hypothetical protein